MHRVCVHGVCGGVALIDVGAHSKQQIMRHSLRIHLCGMVMTSASGDQLLMALCYWSTRSRSVAAGMREGGDKNTRRQKCAVTERQAQAQAEHRLIKICFVRLSNMADLPTLCPP